MGRLLTPSNLQTIRFEVTGFDEYLKKIQAAGRNVEEVAAQAVKASVQPIYQDLKDWIDDHKLTGATAKGLSVSDIKREGGRIFVELGIDTTDAPLAWHAVFVEYGTPKVPADPGIRLAFNDNKARVRTIQKKILVRGGIPIG